MSRSYLQKMKQLTNNYSGAYKALYDYCTGWRTLFNSKRWAIQRALTSFDPNHNDIITHLLNEIPSLKDIDPSSKLAAVFNVINSKDQFSYKVQQDLNDIVKLDNARREATVVNMLSRYSAFWIVRLFTGELGNEHVKEIRNLLKQYHSKELSFEQLMINVSDLNVDDADPLNDFKTYFIHQDSEEVEEDSNQPKDSEDSKSSTTSQDEDAELRQEANARVMEEDRRIAEELEKEETEIYKKAELQRFEGDRRIAEQLTKEEAELQQREKEKRQAERQAEEQHRLEEEQRVLQARVIQAEKQREELRNQELLNKARELKAEMQLEREQKEARLEAQRLEREAHQRRLEEDQRITEQLKRENDARRMEEEKRETQRRAEDVAEKRRREMQLLQEGKVRLDKQMEARRREKEKQEAEARAQAQAEAEAATRRIEEEQRKKELKAEEEKRDKLKRRKNLLQQLIGRYLDLSAAPRQLFGLSEEQYQREIVSFHEDINSKKEDLLKLEDVTEINQYIELLQAKIVALAKNSEATQKKISDDKQFLKAAVSQCDKWLKFYKDPTFNNNLPICKRLNAVSILQELNNWKIIAEGLLLLGDVVFCDEFEKMPKIKPISDRHLALVKEYKSESAVEADRQRCLLNIHNKMSLATQNIKNLRDILAAPVLYLGISEAELIQKNQEINALDDSLKAINSDDLQGYTLKELQDVDSRILSMQEQINNLQLNGENKNLKENCKAIVSSITQEIQNILKYIGIYSSGSYLSWALNRDLNELAYHTAKKISDAHDPQGLHDQTKKLCVEIEEINKHYHLSTTGLSYVNICNSTDYDCFKDKLEALRAQIEEQHRKNHEFIELCRQFSAKSSNINWSLKLTYEYLHSIIQLVNFEKEESDNKLLIDSFNSLDAQYRQLGAVAPMTYEELNDRKGLNDRVSSLYKSLLDNKNYPRVHEHCEVVCSIAQEVFEDLKNSQNLYFITPIFKDCRHPWEARIKLNQLANEAGILFTKDMDILGGKFFGTRPPLNYNFNYVEDYSTDEAARRAKIALMEVEKRRLEEHRRREEELRLLILRVLKAKVLSAVKENRNDRYNTTQWNIDYNDQQLSEKIDALFKRENFKARSVSELAHEVIVQLNQVHQKVQRNYYVSYN